MRRPNVGKLESWNLARVSWLLAVLLAVPPSIIPTFQPSNISSFQLSAQSFEQRLLAIPDTASLRQMSHDLSAVPHMAGTPAQAATRDYVLGKLRSWGVDAWSKEYSIYLPQPDTVEASVIVGPRSKPVRLDLREPGTGPQIPPFKPMYRPTTGHFSICPGACTPLLTY